MQRLKNFVAATCFLACGALAAGAARAQLLPPVSLPALPSGMPTDIGSDRAPRLPPIDLAKPNLLDVRLARNRELLRRYADRIEADPNGDPVVRNEIVAYLPSAALLDNARAQGFAILRQKSLTGLGAATIVLRPPRGVSTQEGFARLRELAPDDALDFNHIYGNSGEVSTREPETRETPNKKASSLEMRRIGLIDGGVDGDTDALHDIRVRREGCRGRTIASAHGTAVASIMVGMTKRFRGAAPGMALYAADVFCSEPTGGSVDAIATAFDWLAANDVFVINVSLVGPPNRILERIVARAIARGHAIVAAVGNDGPAAAPLYPASYPGVIGVTAVDASMTVLPEAARGQQVAFAAPGADMAAAAVPRGYASVRGTSFAAPVVAGLLALHYEGAGDKAVAHLIAAAEDLGQRGKDPVYGNGLVGREVRIAPSVVGAR